nr:hypothetical protein CFP56_38307 [Quercus suber]
MESAGNVCRNPIAKRLSQGSPCTEPTLRPAQKPQFYTRLLWNQDVDVDCKYCCHPTSITTSKNRGA